MQSKVNTYIVNTFRTGVCGYISKELSDKSRTGVIVNYLVANNVQRKYLNQQYLILLVLIQSKINTVVKPCDFLRLGQ